ncbi:MAG TPA: amino acid permease [Longimicrobiales bacterium]|nr:amino acid permease [Longimicrobiales bacterium]
MSLWGTKPLSALRQEAGADTMSRVLGPVGLTTLGVGAIIGAGIFVLTGQAAAQYAGPAIVISFVVAGVACAFAGLAYAELASMIPVAGSAYTYSYATLGQFVAWIIGWDLILEYSLGAATVAVGWSGYVVSFLRDLGISVPAPLASAPGMAVLYPHHGVTDPIFNLPAALIVLMVTLLLVLGIKESARANAAVVLVKLLVIAVFLVAGASAVDPGHWQPFIPENTGTFGEYGWSGILRGAGVIFFAYIGFDAVSTAAQEAKNPARDLPIGILVSLAVCTLLYIAVALVVTGIVPFRELGVPDPIAVAIDHAGIPWLRFLIKGGAIAGLSSVILVMLMAQPRIFYAMARDGFLPPVFGRIHPRFKTPHVSTLITGVVVAMAAGIFPIGVLGEMVSIGTLLAFVLVCFGVVVLRRTAPEAPRPFRAPGAPVTPLLGAIGCLYLMAGLPLATWLRLGGWLVLGLVIYFGYGRARATAVLARPTPTA